MFKSLGENPLRDINAKSSSIKANTKSKNNVIKWAKCKKECCGPKLSEHKKLECYDGALFFLKMST